MNRNGVWREEPNAELVGEVIESSTTDFLAQACRLDAAPAFGSFIEVAVDDGLRTIGVVAHVQTAGIDPGARAIMRGHDQVRDELIYQENPDLPLVLRTTFRALVVGFAESGLIFQFLPPRPARLHYSVYPCGADRVRAFTDAGLDYLSTLIASPDVPTDELLAANIRLTAAQRGETERFTEQAGRQLAHLLRADYARLTAILRRCLGAEPMVTLDTRG
jgi:hypothetical protein